MVRGEERIDGLRVNAHLGACVMGLSFRCNGKGVQSGAGPREGNVGVSRRKGSLRGPGGVDD
jgi:hypothetical protein